ncbi:MAG: sensor histidine kinase [Alphaproteobacteria bacterium]
MAMFTPFIRRYLLCAPPALLFTLGLVFAVASSEVIAGLVSYVMTGGVPVVVWVAAFVAPCLIAALELTIFLAVIRSLREHVDHLDRVDAVLRRDIAARRQVEMALRASEEKLRAIFNTAAIGIALTDCEGLLIQGNPALGRILDCSPEDMIGREVSVFLHPEERAEAMDAFFELMDSSTLDFERDLRLVSLGGQVIWAHVTLTVVRDADGVARYSVGMVEDITARRAAVASLGERTSELARSNAEMEQLVRVVSHDLQEPLRTVTGFVQLLQRQYDGGSEWDARDHVGFAVAAAHRMERLIKDLLMVSRVTTHGQAFTLVDMEAVVSEAVETLRTAIDSSGADIAWDPLPSLDADDRQMVNLFQNLIGNAIKFHRPDTPPRVHIGAAKTGATWTFSVKDNGIGVDPGFRERVFVIFQQLDRQAEGGSIGIGLALCKKIVARHGGSIWVSPAEDGGSIFRFTLKG